ncbi:MAG: helix-turn-helix domain-containing protein [Desulfuromonadales bacterium]|nr:helix-turn-helix domain-containing protein [Desulfuromonadales bacterium]
MKIKSFGEKLRDFRTSRLMTLQQMSATLGVSCGFLSEAERDKKMPGGAFFIALKRNYGVSIDYFLDSEENMMVSEEQDPYIANVTKMMRGMDEETKKDVQLNIEKQKLLFDLLKKQQRKKKR